MKKYAILIILIGTLVYSSIQLFASNLYVYKNINLPNLPSPIYVNVEVTISDADKDCPAKDCSGQLWIYVYDYDGINPPVLRDRQLWYNNVTVYNFYSILTDNNGSHYIVVKIINNPPPNQCTEQFNQNPSSALVTSMPPDPIPIAIDICP